MLFGNKMCYMRLKGDSGNLEVKILVRKKAFSTDFWEENWLYSSINGRFPGFDVNYKCNLRIDDLKRWQVDITKLINENTPYSISLKTMEEGIGLDFEKKENGMFYIRGRLVATELTGCYLTCSWEIDTEELQRFLSELSNNIIKYPIIGRP